MQRTFGKEVYASAPAAAEVCVLCGGALDAVVPSPRDRALAEGGRTLYYAQEEEERTGRRKKEGQGSRKKRIREARLEEKRKREEEEDAEVETPDGEDDEEEDTAIKLQGEDLVR